MNTLTPTDFYHILKKKFPHDPTLKQEQGLREIAAFVLSKEKDEVFLLKGFAGTGKTSILGTLVHSLWETTMKSVLMAPTGRAAKVMTNYAKTQAFTIHKKIYFTKKDSGGGVKFILAPNKHRNTIFMVDEASMVPDVAADSKLFENGSLLDDLFMYVYSGHNCKLMLIGDTAQLPPVHLELSPALDEHKLALNFNKEVIKVELDEVVRQAQDSGILFNATNIREQLQGEFYDDFKFNLASFKDIIRLVDGNDIQEAIDQSYSQNGKEETAFIVRSNKTCL